MNKEPDAEQLKALMMAAKDREVLLAFLALMGWCLYALPTAALFALYPTFSNGQWFVLIWGGTMSSACMYVMWNARRRIRRIIGK